LNGARVKDAAVAARVGMFERALCDVCDSLDVPVRMHGPGRSRNESIVVEDAQIADNWVGLVQVLIEAEMPVGAEPSAFGVEQRRARSENDGHRAARAVRPRRSR